MREPVAAETSCVATAISEAMMLTSRIAVIVACLFAAAPSFASAANVQATPATLAGVLAKAKSGETIVLGPGAYPGARLTHAHFASPLTIEAGSATLVGWQFSDTSGVTIVGGEFRLPPVIQNPKTNQPIFGYAIRLNGVSNLEIRKAHFQGPGKPGAGGGDAYGEGYGIFLDKGEEITVVENSFAGFKLGVFLTGVTNFRVQNNIFSEMRSDGLDIAESHKGLIEGNQCGGTVIRDKEHPDCVQMWSRHTSEPVSDMIIRKNKVVGNSQGIGLYNHVHEGVDDGGFDRITIEDNEVQVGFSQGIALYEGRNSIVRNNHVSTYPGAQFRASINITGDVKRCGNVVEDGAGHSGSTDPHC
jgi:hypothetical protein